MSGFLTRRTMIAQTALAAGGVAAAGQQRVRASESEKPSDASAPPFGYCLNTGTLQGFKLPLVEEVEIAAQAGYQAIEPWVGEIRRYVEGGGKPADLKKRIADLGLFVPSALGFGDWLDDDPNHRAVGREQWKRDAELVLAIGGRRMTAAAGSAARTRVEPPVVAERYRQLLEICHAMGVMPELELWGFSKSLCRVSEIAYVLAEVAHPDACGLLDVFHIYKGGSDFAAVRVFNGSVLSIFHINDYPVQPPREKIRDRDRVYPGDGVAPLVPLLRDLCAIGFRGMLSLELFNRQYWKQDPRSVARTGLEKTRAVVQRALG